MGKKKQKGIIQELRRRHVFNPVALYIVGAWVALQAAELALPGLNIPDFAIREKLTGFLSMHRVCGEHVPGADPLREGPGWWPA